MLENLICGSLVYAGSCDLKRRQSMVVRHGSISNPFIAYDDGYDWPDLYTECDEMVETCVLVYLLAELRSLVRRGEATTKSEQVMQMPLAARDLMRVINSSRELLTTNYSTCGDLAVKSTKFSMELLRTTEERFMRIKKRKKKARKEKSWQSPDEDEDSNSPEEDGTKPIIGATTFLSFDDDFKKEELYYAIGVNHDRRRITVCFRGSVVSNLDWATDFDSSMREVKNPMKMHSSQQPTMKIHSKLHDLLYAESLRNVAESGDAGGGGGAGMNSIAISRGGEVWTEFMDILQNKIRPATSNYPGYKLYITGHSFGGALATLFAFLAAAEPDAIIPKPVTCVSIASPYVGDESFRQAHQMLEGLGKLRHVRVSNHMDVVTASPKVSFRWRFYGGNDDGGGHVGSLFKHVGMNLRLYQHETPVGIAEGSTQHVPSPSYEISYPKVPFGFFFVNYFDEMARGWDQSPFANLSCNPVDYWTWPWHNIREYNKRLGKNKYSLQKMSLNDLYSRKDIVGNLGCQY